MSFEKIRKPSPKNTPKKSIDVDKKPSIEHGEALNIPLNNVEVITIYVSPDEGILSYHRSSDGKSFPLQLFQDNRFKIRESTPFELKNGVANEYDILKINTKDKIPTFQLKARIPAVIGPSGGGRRRTSSTTEVKAYGQVFKNVSQTVAVSSSVSWNGIQNNLNVSQSGTNITVSETGIYQIEFFISSALKIAN